MGIKKLTDIRDLTAGYVAAFNARDLDKVAVYLAEGFELTDPDVTALTPKNKVLAYIRELFEAHEFFSLHARAILVDGDTSVVHFTLTLGAQVIDGVDIIKWKAGQMINMKAYITPRHLGPIL